MPKSKWDIDETKLDPNHPEWEAEVDKLHNVPARIRARMRHNQFLKKDLDKELLESLHYQTGMIQGYVTEVLDHELDIILNFINIYTLLKRGEEPGW